jgi:hypothetical protein
LARRAAAGPATPERDDQFVTNCEHVISIQNETWMAAWGTE